MGRLLQLSTYGMKNLEKEITINFCNTIIEKGIKKVNNVKGIYGYNGSGKSALISSIDLYKNIVMTDNYLVQNNVIDNLNKLINYKKNEFFIQFKFEIGDNQVIKHSIKLIKDDNANRFCIKEEDIGIANSRSLDGTFEILISKNSENFTLNDSLYEKYNMLNFDCLNTSIIKPIMRKMLLQEKFSRNNLNISEYYIIELYMSIFLLGVYLSDSDKHQENVNDVNLLKNIIDKSGIEDNNLFNKNLNYYFNADVVNKNEFKTYEQENKKLEKFVRLFKPDVKKIELDKREDKNVYHVKKIFAYDNYNIDYEYESSGIKQIVKLFSYLIKCANGGIVFIDEIDTNINSVYFVKLIEYFKNYGKGQLIFTTHNVESMSVLKKQSRSIEVLGNDNNLDVWVGTGNKSPINDYFSGLFPSSPMNIEDFDFISIFSLDYK